MGAWTDEFKRQIFGTKKKKKKGGNTNVSVHYTRPAQVVYKVYTCNCPQNGKQKTAYQVGRRLVRS